MNLGFPVSRLPQVWGCYCLLTRLPFFDLHFQVLWDLLAAERIMRMTVRVYVFLPELGIAASRESATSSRCCCEVAVFCLGSRYSVSLKAHASPGDCDHRSALPREPCRFAMFLSFHTTPTSGPHGRFIGYVLLKSG